MTYDIDAARAQRQEAVGGPDWPFKFGGVTYRLPREIPWALSQKINAIEAADGMDGLAAIFEVLLAGQNFPLEQTTVNDLAALLQTYMQEVGATLGEFETSPSSSESTARPSKPTSKRTTGSTSRRSTAARSRGGA